MIERGPVNASRRDFLAGVGAFALGAGAGLSPSAGHPVVRSVFQTADTEVLVVSDGEFLLPTAYLLAAEAPQEKRDDILNSANRDGNRLRMPANVTLIRQRKELILVDAGFGPGEHQTAGKLAASLRSIGIEPGAISKIILSHAHPDHLWGISLGDELAFPNASYIICGAEWDFWMNPDLPQNLPEPGRRIALGAWKHLPRIKDKIKTIKFGEEVVTGIRAVDTAGHTRGHMSIEIGGSDGLLVIGDALTHTEISFRYPAWPVPVDQEPDRAIAMRRRLLDQLVARKMLIVGYHFPFPGLGTVERKEGAYRFAPV
jgi:glyoxylase-like metal-dependent hydrolase (beta-lactamase superfamily II)